VEAPAPVRGWYFDGGTRLNTPIKPAISLGADRVVVVGLNSIAGRGRRPHDLQPDLAEGAGQLAQAVLVDPLVNDIQTLATENRIVADAQEQGAEVAGRRPIPYVFVAPRTVDAIGELAKDVFNRHFSGARGLLRSRDMALLGHLAAGGRDAVHGELLSYVFFEAEFTRELLELGRDDARHWLGQQHDDGIWRISSPPPRS
jgi:NTE family protein